MTGQSVGGSRKTSAYTSLINTSMWPVRLPGIEITYPDQKMKASASHLSSNDKALTYGSCGLRLMSFVSNVPLKVKIDPFWHGTA